MKKIILLFLLLINYFGYSRSLSTRSDTVNAFYTDGEDAFFSFLSLNIIYPQWPKEKCIGGVVYVTFKIKQDGKLDSVNVKNVIGYGLDEEAIRVIKLTDGKWTSAKLDGKAIISDLIVPIKFNIKGCKTPSEKKMQKLKEEYSEKNQNNN